MNILYCIEHEKEVTVEEGLVLVHMVITGIESDLDMNWCEGPFAYCPPPDEDNDSYYDWLFFNEDAIQDLLDYYIQFDN